MTKMNFERLTRPGTEFEQGPVCRRQRLEAERVESWVPPRRRPLEVDLSAETPSLVNDIRMLAAVDDQRSELTDPERRWVLDLRKTVVQSGGLTDGQRLKVIALYRSVVRQDADYFCF